MDRFCSGIPCPIWMIGLVTYKVRWLTSQLVCIFFSLSSPLPPFVPSSFFFFFNWDSLWQRKMIDRNVERNSWFTNERGGKSNKQRTGNEVRSKTSNVLVPRFISRIWELWASNYILEIWVREEGIDGNWANKKGRLGWNWEENPRNT